MIKCLNQAKKEKQGPGDESDKLDNTGYNNSLIIVRCKMYTKYHSGNQ